MLLNALGPGQTGCLTDGATFNLGGGEAITSTAGTAAQPKTLRPETPGARTTIQAATGFWFQKGSHDIVLKDLNLRRTLGGGGSLLLLDGDRLTLDGVDATYPLNICVDIGDDPRAGAVDSSDDIVIRNSRIHHCGSQYGEPKGANDSGVHGIYVQFARRLLIEDNLIYANNNRGIQLYPDADDTIIRRNVLHANGANFNLGSERGQAIYSERTLAENNILTDSGLSGLRPGGFVGDTSEVLGNFPPPGAGVPDFANRVERNCIGNTAHPTELYEGFGFTQTGNIENQVPGYANPGAGDFRLAPGSPCLGKGPRSIQPGDPPPDPRHDCQGAQADVVGTEGPDVISGLAAREIIQALGGDDTIRNLDADAACGGEGYDTFRAPFTAYNQLDGEGGADLVDYSGVAGGSIQVDLDGFAPGVGEDFGPGFGNNLYSISDVYGTVGADEIIGSSEANFVRGGPGADAISGEDGNDLIFGDGGTDTVSGGAANDTLKVRDGDRDTVTCGEGTDTVEADREDEVAGDCERVDRGATPDQPPQTTIDAGPSGTVDSNTARFGFHASEPASFQCSRDGGAFAPCSSPTVYTELAEGGHSFAVRAIDRAGNPDPTPAARSWIVVLPPFNCTPGARNARLAKALRSGVVSSFKCTQTARVTLRLTLARSTARRLGLAKSRRGGPVTVAKARATGKSGKRRLRFSRKSRRALGRQRRVGLTLRSAGKSTQSNGSHTKQRKLVLKR